MVDDENNNVKVKVKLKVKVVQYNFEESQCKRKQYFQFMSQFQCIFLAIYLTKKTSFIEKYYY